MPGGLLVRHPFGQSSEEGQEVQLDSRDGTGGAPTIRNPMTFENVLRVTAGYHAGLREAIRVLTTHK